MSEPRAVLPGTILSPSALVLSLSFALLDDCAARAEGDDALGSEAGAAAVFF